MWELGKSCEVAILLYGQSFFFFFFLNPRLIQLVFQKFPIMLIANLCGKRDSILNYQDGCISS